MKNMIKNMIKNKNDNTMIGHYIYRMEDLGMTQEEFDDLKHGDIIESKFTQNRYVIISPKMAGEPLTQIKKDDIKNNNAFNVIYKSVPLDTYCFTGKHKHTTQYEPEDEVGDL